MCYWGILNVVLASLVLSESVLNSGSRDRALSVGDPLLFASSQDGLAAGSADDSRVALSSQSNWNGQRDDPSQSPWPRLPKSLPCDSSLRPPSNVAIISQYCRVKKQNTTVCYRAGSSQCKCTGGLADCSGSLSKANLDYAPSLPNVSCLYFAYNNVKYLNDTFFVNVSHISVLDLSNNFLTSVSQGAFAVFRDLKYLVLSENSLSSDSLRNIIRFAPTLRLDMINVHLETTKTFKEFNNISIKEITLDKNPIEILDLGDFSSIKNLQILSFRCCSIDGVTSAKMPTLKSLDLRNNNITVFPQTCSEPSSSTTQDQSSAGRGSAPVSSLVPNLSQLFLDVNGILQLPNQTSFCLPKMAVLSLAENNITRVPYKLFASLTKLSRLDFRKMSRPIKFIEDGAFGAPYMTTLYLSKNNISFKDANISRSMFEGATSIVDLYIDHNQIGSTPEDVLLQIFNYTVNVQHLYLSDAGMTSIPASVFANFPRLKYLFLYNNKIQTIPPAAFDGAKSLTKLYLQNNQISVVREESFSPETISRLVEIDLSLNMFLCNCDLLWFQTWLKSNASTFAHNNLYICSDRHNEHVQDYAESLQACFMSRATYVIFVVCLSVMLFAFLMFVTLFRYRWQIRLMLYERRSSSRQMARMQRDYTYDIFIIYCNDDKFFVEKELLNVLEKEWKLKVCIHARDFLAGGSIFTNMGDCMNSSKRIMAVISSDFAKSSWCNFELEFCQSHVIHHDLPNLLVVKMNAIESRDMRAALYALYNTCTVLELPDPDDPTINQKDFAPRMRHFWKRLHASLQSILPEEQKNLRQFGTQTSFSGQALGATPLTLKREPLRRQLSEQAPRPKPSATKLKRQHSEMPAIARGGASCLKIVAAGKGDRTPLIKEADEPSEETSVMHT